jgi:hypothetical protein
VVERPTRDGGRGFALTGHHEIMFPLLAAAIRVELNESPQAHPTAADRPKSNRVPH